MSTYEDFYKSLDAEPDKGTAFEIFVKWFLKHDPEWSTQVDEVWLWDDYPDRWGRDLGIDLVFRHKNGQIWSVQAKCYSPENTIKKSDIDSFISESSSKHIDKNLLIATTDNIGANAKAVLKRNDAVSYLKSDFENSDIVFPENIRKLNKAKRKDKPKPTGKYEYQQEAINNVVKHLKNNDRCQLIMACGTGKSYTSLWIKEKLNAKRTLVLVPSLSLLSQILKDWTFAANKSFEVLCVCSDKTVGKKDYDSIIDSTADLHFPVTSDTNEIKQFLKQDKDQVIFCTYQSSPLIEESHKHKRFPDFDLVIADEAHRCAGKVEGAFSTILDNKNIKATKRVFTTATPRIYSSNLKKKAEERGVEIACMDDHEIFGEVAHTLSFSESISKGLLTDYKVVVVGIDDQTISTWITNREVVDLDKELLMDAASLAAMIGLIKIMGNKEYDLRRIITFHNRIKGAKQFKDDILDVIDWIESDKRPTGEIWSDSIDGTMTADARNKKLKRLKTLTPIERGIISNARCLSEGVDVPALDGVGFFEPRRSQIDIIQSVGRAIRLSQDKKHGVIFIPVFIEEGENPESKIEASNFKPVWDIVNALKSHDNVLKVELDQYRYQLGKKSRSTIRSFSHNKIVFDLPANIDKSFEEKLKLIVVEKTTESWMFLYGLLHKYKEQYGNCLVPATFKIDGYSLGYWVVHQRVIKYILTQEKRDLLDALDFVWDVAEFQWQMGYNYLRKYFKEHGKSLVPYNYKVDGFNLGQWVVTQRNNKESISQDRRERLDALGFVWNKRDFNWEKAYSYLEDYVSEHGNCLVPFTYKKNGFKLGSWVLNQRIRKDILTQERRDRLDALGFVWNKLEAQWQTAYSYLEDYVSEHGNCLVPRNYKVEDFNLGMWVCRQRDYKDTLSEQRRDRLESLGFVWNQLEVQWEEGYAQLKSYFQEHGNCLVPQGHIRDGYNLGSWVARQRRKKDSIISMTKDRRDRLDALGFVWNTIAE